MVSINTDGDRTLFFDFLPLELGKLMGCDVQSSVIHRAGTGALAVRLENWS